MAFSTIEFLGFMFLIFSVFSFDIRYYKKEILITSVGMTLLSYLFVIYQVEQLLLPVEIAVLVLTFKIGFREKWLYSLWIAVAGLFTYLVIQIGILLISIQAGLLTYAETSHTFGFKTYLLQSLTATIVITIATYIKTQRQGFGFTFRTKLKKPLYFSVALASILTCSICFYLYSINANQSSFYLLVSSFVVLFLATIFLSHRKEREEFSFT